MLEDPVLTIVLAAVALGGFGLGFWLARHLWMQAVDDMARDHAVKARRIALELEIALSNRAPCDWFFVDRAYRKLCEMFSLPIAAHQRPPSIAGEGAFLRARQQQDPEDRIP